MESALIKIGVDDQENKERNYKDNQKEIEKGNILDYLPGNITMVRERITAISPAVIIGVIMGGWSSITTTLLIGIGFLITYAIYWKVKKAPGQIKNLTYVLVLFIALIPNTTQWWLSVLGGILVHLYWIVLKDKGAFNLSVAVWLLIVLLGGANQSFGSIMEPEQMPSFKMYIANTRAGMGEIFLPALLAGGAYLLYKKVISRTLVLSFIGTVTGLSFLGGDNPLMHLLTGSLVLGVFFLTPDMRKLSRRFKLFYGICGGILAIVMRFFGDFLTAVPIAILIMDWIMVNKLIRDWRDGKLCSDQAEQVVQSNKVEQTDPAEHGGHKNGWAVFILASLGLIVSIVSSDSSTIVKFFMSMDILSSFAILILSYITIHSISTMKNDNYNSWQMFLTSIAMLAVVYT